MEQNFEPLRTKENYNIKRMHKWMDEGTDQWISELIIE